MYDDEPSRTASIPRRRVLVLERDEMPPAPERQAAPVCRPEIRARRRGAVGPRSRRARSCGRR